MTLQRYNLRIGEYDDEREPSSTFRTDEVIEEREAQRDHFRDFLRIRHRIRDSRTISTYMAPGKSSSPDGLSMVT